MLLHMLGTLEKRHFWVEGEEKALLGYPTRGFSCGRQRVHFSFIVSICNVGNYWHIVHWEYEKKKNYFEA